ncbi:MAG: DUF1287 domain-containing protein [Luteimonas sp.]
MTCRLLGPGVMLLLLLAGCVPAAPGTEPPGTGASASRTPASTSAPQLAAPASASSLLVAAARKQVGVTLLYDPAYVALAYPGGDVPQDRGVCTDVVVRAFREAGIDLQRSLHEDMRAHFADYPRQWGSNEPDRNIDHRRVPNQMRWFDRQGWAQPVSKLAADYSAGDIAAWQLSGNGLLHIGIVSDRKTADGTPLILHNIGIGTQESDIVFSHQVVGHYRPVL